MCQPSERTILEQARLAVKEIGAKSVFVASDHDSMIQALKRHLSDLDVSVVSLDQDNPQLDLVILGQSDLFIGNCVSSFSAFVKRERDANELPTHFWAFPEEVRHDSGEL